MTRVVLIALLLLTAAAPSTVVHRIAIHERDSLAIEISVPSEWGTVRHPADPTHRSHREIVIAVNNRGTDSLLVTTMRTDLGTRGTQYSFGPEAFEQQLTPGTVYVEVGYLVGGPLPMSTPYAWTLEEKPSVAIQQAIRVSDEDWTTGKVVVHRAGFIHWGLGWQAFVAARKPFLKRDLDRAFSIIESLRFPDIPVSDPRQAIELAIPALPEDFRKEFADDPTCACCRLYEVESVPIENGFHVTFNLMETQTRRLVRSMSVNVDRDGRAVRR